MSSEFQSENLFMFKVLISIASQFNNSNLWVNIMCKKVKNFSHLIPLFSEVKQIYLIKCQSTPKSVSEFSWFERVECRNYSYSWTTRCLHFMFPYLHIREGRKILSEKKLDIFLENNIRTQRENERI